MAEEAEVTPQPEPLPEVPEFYADRAGVTVSPYSVLIEYALQHPRKYADSLVPQARVWMSPQHAWVFSKILARVLREYIEKEGPISLPKSFLVELGLAEEYRQDMEVHNG